MEFLVAMIAGIVFIAVLKGLKRDESLHRAGKNAKQCPHCLEWVKAGATVCRYCQRDVPETAKVAPPVQYGPRRNEFKVIGWAVGVMLVVALIAALAG